MLRFPAIPRRGPLTSSTKALETMLRQSLKVALIQLKVGASKPENLRHAKEKVCEAAAKGAKLVVLPECWNSPYAVTAFPEYAEPIPGATSDFMAMLAKDSGIFLVGGSIPEEDGGKYYNTSLTFDPSGHVIGKHRKAHLFDIDVPGKIKFKESDVLSAGNEATIVELDGYGKIGVGICYDIRFAELAAIAARKGAFALVYPGAFNTTTGPLHWQLLARARAVDNQTFVLVDSPAQDLDFSYHAYGHSLVVDPWGKVLCEADEGETTLYADLEPEPLKSVRESIPVGTQRRFDIYPDVSGGK